MIYDLSLIKTRIIQRKLSADTRIILLFFDVDIPNFTIILLFVTTPIILPQRLPQSHPGLLGPRSRACRPCAITLGVVGLREGFYREVGPTPGRISK